MKVYLCNWIEQDGSWSSYIWHNYDMTGTVQMRMNSRHCLVAMVNTDVTPELEADEEVSEVGIELTSTIGAGKAALFESKLGVPAEKVLGKTYKWAFEKMIKRSAPQFDIPKLKAAILAGKQIHIDLVNSEMDL